MLKGKGIIYFKHKVPRHLKILNLRVGQALRSHGTSLCSGWLTMLRHISQQPLWGEGEERICKQLAALSNQQLMENRLELTNALMHETLSLKEYSEGQLRAILLRGQYEFHLCGQHCVFILASLSLRSNLWFLYTFRQEYSWISTLWCSAQPSGPPTIVILFKTIGWPGRKTEYFWIYYFVLPTMSRCFIKRPHKKQQPTRLPTEQSVGIGLSTPKIRKQNHS